MNMEGWDNLCTRCGGTGRDWRTKQDCEECINGEAITPRLIYRLAAEYERDWAKDPWNRSVHA